MGLALGYTGRERLVQAVDLVPVGALLCQHLPVQGDIPSMFGCLSMGQFPASPSFIDKLEDQPFPIGIVTNAPAGHDPSVTYEMTFTFDGVSSGYIWYANEVYNEGEVVPLVYGSSSMNFTPTRDENFVINFRVENSTGISQTVSESITILKKPVVAVKGEKHNLDCGGLNGCDYTVRIYTCFAANCSEAYNGATLRQVEVRIYNRKARRWDTMLFNYNDAKGSGVERYFELEEEPKENDLRYLDQDYEVRVQDSNGQWSDTIRGTIVRV